VCAEALSRIAATSGHPYALAALARAIGESRCSTTTAATAAEQLSARPRSTAASTSRSSARRWSCARASRWPRPATARPRSSASAAPTAPRASSAPARWRPRRRAEVAKLGGSVSRR
jgi:hypothetical protein